MRIVSNVFISELKVWLSFSLLMSKRPQAHQVETHHARAPRAHNGLKYTSNNNPISMLALSAVYRNDNNEVQIMIQIRYLVYLEVENQI